MSNQLRKVFEEECLNGSHSHRYQERCEQLHQRWKWFNPRPTAEWMIEAEPEAYRDNEERLVEELQAGVKRLEKAVGLLPWFIIGLGLLLLWRT